MAAPCARLQLVRGPERKSGGGRPFNTIVRRHVRETRLSRVRSQMDSFESLAGVALVLHRMSTLQRETHSRIRSPASRVHAIGIWSIYCRSCSFYRFPRCDSAWDCRRVCSLICVRHYDRPPETRGAVERVATWLCSQSVANDMTSNKSLERTVNHCGRTVRAFAVSARAGALGRSWPAVQHNR